MEGCRFRGSDFPLLIYRADLISHPLFWNFHGGFLERHFQLLVLNLSSSDKLRGSFCGKDDFQSVQGDFPPRHQWRYCIRSLRYPLSRFCCINIFESTKVQTSKTTRGSAQIMKEWVRKEMGWIIQLKSLNRIRKFATLLISDVY